MKYAGNVTIFKDGEMIFDRELTGDEIIDALLTKDAVPPPLESEEEPEPAAAPAKKRGRPRNANSMQGAAHPCCGSKGKRHKKDCPGTNAAPSSDRESASPRFSEATFHVIKTLLKSGLTADEIASSKGFDFAEIERARDCRNYDEYFRAH